MSDSYHFARSLSAHFARAGAVSDEQAMRLWQHYELLTRWNRILNLTGIRTMEEAIVRHYCESLFVGLHLPPEPVSVIDLGSGSGFPGVPMAVLRPDCAVTLAECHLRKAAFLREATRDLPNIRIAAQRAESIEAAFDWVVSRAVAWKQLRKHAARLGRTVALLLSRADAESVRSSPGFSWRPPVPLPWGRQSVLLVGTGCFT